ncbi:MAG: FAD-dependent oxidoreductase [Streptomycetaceae bacterium]|nr:MAG: FAD-dependent oxidoreductase [Streptomycetaceae bacterium]
MLDVNESLREAHLGSYWASFLSKEVQFQPPVGELEFDLTIIGAGFTGLWSAILAKDRYPTLNIAVFDAGLIGSAASSRNGGFISESLSHGHIHGMNLWSDEMAEIVAMGRENFTEIENFLINENIDAQLVRCGKRVVATKPHHLAELDAAFLVQTQMGEHALLQDQVQIQKEISSPTYLGAIRIYSGSGLLNPAQLIKGLTQSAVKRGIVFFENSPVGALKSRGNAVFLSCPKANIKATKVILATNAFTPLLKRIQPRILPLFEHVLTTQILTNEQLASLNWKDSEGITDMGNQFHYYRKTADNRILWGGYDAQYYFNNNTSTAHENRSSSFELIASQFFETFPQLNGVKFDYKWAGMIDSTTRFTPYFGTAHKGAIAYAVGFTGLGVAASRFGAQTCLDLLYEPGSKRLELNMVRNKPIPFPPEPFRLAAVVFTRKSLQRQDLTGKRGLWLRILDAFKVGFNS